MIFSQGESAHHSIARSKHGCSCFEIESGRMIRYVKHMVLNVST